MQGFSQPDPTALFEQVEQAGIQGMGGGGFSTARKLQLAKQAKVTRVIANAVECEPGIRVDAALLAEHSPEVVQGLTIVMAAIGATQGVLAFAADFPKTTIDALRQQFQSHADAGLDVGNVTVNQPGLTCTPIARTAGAGAERNLCQQLFNLTLGPTQYPIECGVLCLNVGTLFAIQQAIVLGQPLQQRLVTLNGITDWVALGTPFTDLLNFAEQPGAKNTWRYREGGHYTGKLSPPKAVVTAATNAVWLVEPIPETPCTYCSRCSDACPESLAPQTLLRLCREPQAGEQTVQSSSELSSPAESESALEANGLLLCTECGLCNNLCPSNIDLLGSFQQAKAQAREQELAAAGALRAKQRHERHLLRTEARAQVALQRRESRRESRRLKQRGPDAWR